MLPLKKLRLNAHNNPCLHRHFTHANLVEYLIDNGASINAKDDYGRKPLHRAAPKDLFFFQAI